LVLDKILVMTKLLPNTQRNVDNLE
jgi:hypothetical protein